MSSDPTNLDIASIVTELRQVREASLIRRQRAHRPPRLPSRTTLKEIVEGLATALFPNRLGTGQHSNEGVDYYVGNLLDGKLRMLTAQVQRELVFAAEHLGNARPDDASLEQQAVELVRTFAHRLPALRTVLDSDLQAAFEGDPAARSVDEVLVCYPGLNALINHRLAHELHRLGAPLTARMIAEISHSSTGIDIHPGAQIGASFFIDHGTGVVIGETTRIGERVRLYQAVTLGAKRFPTDENGALVKGQPRHPIVEDDVVIYAGATILGRITIGRGSTIGGNVWLTRSVPPGSNITQSQAKQELFDHGAGV